MEKETEKKVSKLLYKLADLVHELAEATQKHEKEHEFREIIEPRRREAISQLRLIEPILETAGVLSLGKKIAMEETRNCRSVSTPKNKMNLAWGGIHWQDDETDPMIVCEMTFYPEGDTLFVTYIASKCRWRSDFSSKTGDWLAPTSPEAQRLDSLLKLGKTKFISHKKAYRIIKEFAAVFMTEYDEPT